MHKVFSAVVNLLLQKHGAKIKFLDKTASHKKVLSFWTLPSWVSLLNPYGEVLDTLLKRKLIGLLLCDRILLKGIISLNVFSGGILIMEHLTAEAQSLLKFKGIF